MATSEDDTWNPLEKTPIHSNGNYDPAAMSHPHGQRQQSSPSAVTAGPPDLANIDTSRLLELQGGVGYWTEEGELILEVEAHHMLGITNEYDHDTDNECDDDDIDSNCEDYGGNDYPDEDYDSHWEEQFLREEPLVGDDDSDDHSGRGYGGEDVW